MNACEKERKREEKKTVIEEDKRENRLAAIIRDIARAMKHFATFNFKIQFSIRITLWHLVYSRDRARTSNKYRCRAINSRTRTFTRAIVPNAAPEQKYLVARGTRLKHAVRRERKREIEGEKGEAGRATAKARERERERQVLCIHRRCATGRASVTSARGVISAGHERIKHRWE